MHLFLSTLDDRLDSFEKIMWRGKPQKIAYVSSAFGGIPFAVVFLLIAWIFHNFGGAPLFELPVIISIVVAIGLLIIPPIWILKRYPHEEYMITNQRLLIKTGTIQDNIWFAQHNEIKEIIVKKSVLDKLLGTGKIYPITANYPYAPKIYGYVNFYWRGGRYIKKKVYNIPKRAYEEVPQIVLYRKTTKHPHLKALNQPHLVEKLLREMMKK